MAITKSFGALLLALTLFASTSEDPATCDHAANHLNACLNPGCSNCPTPAGNLGLVCKGWARCGAECFTAASCEALVDAEGNPMATAGSKTFRDCAMACVCKADCTE